MKLIELPFIGREDIIQLYKDKLKDVLNYKGYVLTIVGVPGIGKTRLNQQILNLTDKNVFFTFSLKTETHTTLNDLFRQIISTFLSRKAINDIVPSVIDEDLYTIFVRHFPILKSLYPYEPLKKKEIEIAPEKIYQFLKNLSNLYPIVISIDDFHLGTLEIRNLTNLLIRNIESLPVFLVINLRPEETTINWLNSFKSASPLFIFNLTPFSKDEVSLLNEKLFHGELSEELFEWIYDKTEGNPLFIVEFIRFLIAKDIIYFDTHKNKCCLHSPFTDIFVPNTLSLMVENKIKSFSERVKKFIKRASLISTDVFNQEMIDVLLSSEELDRLRNDGIIIQKNGKYAFAHSLIKEIVYNTIPKKERRRLHYSLGNYLFKKGMNEEAIHQYYKAGRQDRNYLKMLMDEIDKYHKIKEHSKALSYEEIALKLFEQRTKLLNSKTLPFFIDSANSLRRVGRYKDAIYYYKFAFRYIKKNQTGKLLKVFPFLYYSQTLAELRLGNCQKVINLVNQAKKLIKRYGLQNENNYLIELEINRALAYKDLDMADKALDIALKLEERYKNQMDSNQLFRKNNCVTLVYLRSGQYKNAIEWAEKTIHLAQKLYDERYIAATQGNQGIAHLFTGNFQKAEELFLLHQKASLKNGWKREEFMSYLNLGTLYFSQGYLGRAEDEYKKALKTIERLNIKADYLWLSYYYCWLSLFKDDLKKATELLFRGMDIARIHENKNFLKMFQYIQGFISALKNDTKELKEVLNNLKNNFSSDLENEVEFLLLNGLEHIINNLQNTPSLLEDKGFGDIERGLKITDQKQDCIKLVQYLIICSRIFSHYKELKQKAQEFKNTAIEYALKNSMIGWQDLLMPAKVHIEKIPLRIKTFGKLTVELPDHRIVEQKEWEWAKPKQLFAILVNACINDQVLTRDQIGVHLWPDLSREKLANNFHVCLNQLKSVVGEYISYKEKSYQLLNVEIDAKEFKELVLDADNLINAGKIHTAQDNLTKAIKIYKGRFLEDFYEDWVFEMRDIFASLYRRAVLMLGDIYLKKSRIDSAIELVVKLILMDPLDEEAHRFLISCYIQSGEKAKAIRQYKKCAEIFKRELGCEPSEKTKELYRKLL
uniref:Tetratricopeptide repeat protein n=1 Tax=candidate division WOR-3 bacterium TaxID=2052148 RepID=A0A7V0Z3R4_UNCW3